MNTNIKLLATIIATRYSLGPRPSSQSCSEVSHCTSSPRQPPRGRHTCTSSTSRRFTRRSPAPISHCRSVSLLTSTWWFLARYSQASVGPKSRYFACTSFSVLVRTLSGRRRFDTRPRPRCTTPRSPSFFTRRSSSLTQRSLTPNCCAAARCVKCFRFTSCKIFSRSRSFVLNINISCLLIRSVCRFRTGTFYFAGIGTSHFAVTLNQGFIIDMGEGEDFDPAGFVENKLVRHLTAYGGNRIAQAL